MTILTFRNVSHLCIEIEAQMYGKIFSMKRSKRLKQGIEKLSLT
jgi:hypothetical protein